MKNNNWLLYSLAVVKFALPFILQDPFYQPHRDEFLYLAEGHHPAWGFMEVPPLLSIFAWLTHLLGDGFFWIKFWPSLFGAFTYIITGKIILSIGGKAYALFMGFLPFIFGAYLRVHYLFQPNFLEVFFWTLIAFSIIKFIQTPKNNWLYVFGVACGLGMMSKYSIAFFIIALLAGLLLTTHRKIFINKHFYFASLIAVLLFFPNFLWQYNHRFPVVHHMKELEETQLQYVSPVDFLKDQLLMNLPCFFIWIAGLFYIIASKKGRNYIAFFWAYLIVITLLLVFHGKGYYALGIYPVLFAFGSYFFERLTVKRVRFMRYVFLTFPFYFGLLFIPLLLPIFKPAALAELYRKRGIEKYGVLKWEDQQNHPLPQDFADMIGWKETAAKVAGVYKRIPEEDLQNTLVYCRNYAFAGAINFYGKSMGLPEVYSDNASFLFWMPEKYHVKNLILIAHNIPDSADIVFQQFERMTVKDEIEDSLFRENGEKIILFENGNNKVNDMIEKGIARLRNEYTR